ncbi:DeoR family transcriptional regulator [Escherichia coli]|nr:DeoR family transcriptional regulator [Escherichia coli]
MSQQRPDRIKQMLHYLWQHRHLSTQQAMELFGYAEATVRRDFQYIVNQYPGMIRGLQRSREVILMADHSKFDAVEPHAVATLSCIKTIISDSGLPETIAQRYQRAGCQLFLPHSIK